jgi:hypothetical protein
MIYFLHLRLLNFLFSAVLPQWKDIINPIMASKHLGSVPVNLNTFDLGKTRSEYDKVKKGKLAPYIHIKLTD